MALTLQLPDFGYTSNDLTRKFSLIRNYLDDTNSSAEYTAKELTTPADDSSSIELNESECSLEGFLWSLWAMVLKLIQQIPHSHPWQDRMVKVLSAIKEVPRELTPEMERLERSWGMAFWQGLPVFGAETRETWNRGPWVKIPEGVRRYPGDTPFPPDVWTSLNAFTARLTAASVLNFETYATWILRHTLEEERRDEEVDDNLPAAAMWIFYAGRLLYHNVAKEKTRSSETHQPNVHYLRKFSVRFSEERWEFWKERFEFFRNHQVLKQGTRDSVGEPLGFMVEIERLDREPQVDKGSSLPPSGQMTVVQVQGMSRDR